MNTERGFTIVEVIVAIIVLTVGLLGLVATSALVTRMIARGQRSNNAATFAAQRLEILRTTGGRARGAGNDTLRTESGTAVGTNAVGLTHCGIRPRAVLDTAQLQTAHGLWLTHLGVPG